MMKERLKIYERNSNTGEIRWKYIDEFYSKFSWPNYGRLLKTKKNTLKKKGNNSI